MSWSWVSDQGFWVSWLKFLFWVFFLILRSLITLIYIQEKILFTSSLVSANCIWVQSSYISWQMNLTIKCLWWLQKYLDWQIHKLNVTWSHTNINSDLLWKYLSSLSFTFFRGDDLTCGFFVNNVSVWYILCHVSCLVNVAMVTTVIRFLLKVADSLNCDKWKTLTQKVKMTYKKNISNI